MMILYNMPSIRELSRYFPPLFAIAFISSMLRAFRTHVRCVRVCVCSTRPVPFDVVCLDPAHIIIYEPYNINKI